MVWLVSQVLSLVFVDKMGLWNSLGCVFDLSTLPVSIMDSSLNLSSSLREAIRVFV